MKYPILFLFLFHLSLAFAAEKVAIIVSGSGEKTLIDQASRMPQANFYRRYNLFFAPVIRVAQSLTDAGWKTEILYSSQFADCEATCMQETHNCPEVMERRYWTKACMAQELNLNKIKIASNTFDNFLATLDRVVLQPRIAPKQLLLSVITHGEKPGYKGLEKHSWQFNTADGGTEFIEINDPRLAEALALVKARGTKIGILDSSCFGGESTLEFANMACVVTTQNIMNRGMGYGVNSKLADLLDKKKHFDLEELYLEELLDMQIKIDYQDQNTTLPDFYNQPLLSTIRNDDAVVVDQVISAFWQYGTFDEIPEGALGQLEELYLTSNAFSLTNALMKRTGKFESGPKALFRSFKTDFNNYNDYVRQTVRLQQAKDAADEQLSAEILSFSFAHIFAQIDGLKIEDQEKEEIKDSVVLFFSNSWKRNESESKISGRNILSIKALVLPADAIDFASMINREQDQLFMTQMGQILKGLQGQILARVSTTQINSLQELSNQIKARETEIQKLAAKIEKLKTKLGEKLSKLRFYYYLQAERINNNCREFHF